MLLTLIRHRPALFLKTKSCVSPSRSDMFSLMEKMDDELLGILGDAKELVFLAPPIGDPGKWVRYAAPSRRCGFGFYVRMSISGVQRILADGILDMEIAQRFADMASLRFKKYRRSLKWNFSEAQAVADTKNEEENGGALANFLLARLENKFRNEGTLKEVEPQKVNQPSAVRRTVESRLAELDKRLATLASDIAALELKITGLELRLTPYKDLLGKHTNEQPPQPPIPIIWCGSSEKP